MKTGLYTSRVDGRLLLLFDVFTKKPFDQVPYASTQYLSGKAVEVCIYYDFELEKMLAFSTEVFAASFLPVKDLNIISGYKKRIEIMIKEKTKELVGLNKGLKVFDKFKEPKDPWEQSNDNGELPGDICCQRASGKYCFEHDPDTYTWGNK